MLDWNRKAKSTHSWDPYRAIGAIADRDVPQVSPDLPASEIGDRLRASGRSEALVVNGDGKPLGVISLNQAGKPGTAASLMTGISVVLHESVPLSVAASLLAGGESDRIAVVGELGRAVALLSWKDVLSLFAPLKPEGDPP